LLAANELPNFIDLNPTTGKILHRLVKKGRTCRTKLHKQFQDSMFRHAGHANRGVNGAALDEASDHLGASLYIHPVQVSIMLARA
jgi:hypothetical protein